MKLKIKETAWSINRIAGGYNERVTADVCFLCEIGEIPSFGKGGRNFTIDEITENSIGLSVHCVESKYNRTWKIKQGEEINYRPCSFDGGYFYHFSLV